jgi:hypothetical protein
MCYVVWLGFLHVTGYSWVFAVCLVLTVFSLFTQDITTNVVTPKGSPYNFRSCSWQQFGGYFTATVLKLDRQNIIFQIRDVWNLKADNLTAICERII